MLAGPELKTILEDFEEIIQNEFTDLRDLHHNEGLSTQLQFKRDVEKLVSGWKGIGNPFEEECP